MLQELWASSFSVGFLTQELAARFRDAALARHLWEPPPQQPRQQKQCAAAAAAAAEAGDAAGVLGSNTIPGPLLPRTVTVLLYPEDYPSVTNHLDLVRMLEDVTEPYGFKV